MTWLFAQLLLKPDDAKIENRYRIHQGSGLMLRVAILEAREPVVCDRVVQPGADRPAHARAVAAD